MARVPKPTAKASLAIYSTRKDNSGVTRPSPDLLTDGSPSRLSSSQSTTQDSPSDEMIHRRASTSSSLSSYESTDNTSFITLKYSPPSRKSTNMLSPATQSAYTSPSKSKSAELSAGETDESRTRSTRNRKLTGKALDLAVSGKLYKSEKVQNSNDLVRPNNRQSESLRTSPALSLQSHDDIKGIQQTSRSQSRDPTQPSPSNGVVHGLETSNYDRLGAYSVQDAVLQASEAQPLTSDTTDIDIVTPSKKRRRLQSTVNSPDVSATKEMKPTDTGLLGKSSDAKDIQQTPRSLSSKRGIHRSQKGRDSLAGQASLRSTRQRAKHAQLDETKAHKQNAAASDPGLTGPSACDLNCLDEVEILLAFAEHILNEENEQTEDENWDKQSDRNLEKDTLVTEACPKLKTYCRCKHAAKPANTASILNEVGDAQAS